MPRSHALPYLIATLAIAGSCVESSPSPGPKPGSHDPSPIDRRELMAEADRAADAAARREADEELDAAPKGPPEPAAGTEPAAGAENEASADPCRKLARLYCDNGPATCEQMNALLVDTGIPAAECTKGLVDVESLLETAPVELHSITMARYLPHIVLTSPELSPEQRAKFEALAERGPPPQ